MRRPLSSPPPLKKNPQLAESEKRGPREHADRVFLFPGAGTPDALALGIADAVRLILVDGASEAIVTGRSAHAPGVCYDTDPPRHISARNARKTVR
jgi:hypothetical protein